MVALPPRLFAHLSFRLGSGGLNENCYLLVWGLEIEYLVPGNPFIGNHGEHNNLDRDLLKLLERSLWRVKPRKLASIC